MNTDIKTPDNHLLFDSIAEVYYTHTPALPDKYIQLLITTFNIESNTKIIDLGCGSGDLAIAFSKFSSFIEGIDISKTMIEMAKKKDENNKVTWIHKPVDDFEYGENNYDLIISFESFHLFPNQKELIRKCVNALKPGGSLCLGWRTFAFDYKLKTVMEESFAKYNLNYGWGYWTCDNFPSIVSNFKHELSLLHKKNIYIKSKISNETMLTYLLNVSNAAYLEDKLKKKITIELSKGISKIYPSGKGIGNDEYTIQYCTKINRT